MSSQELGAHQTQYTTPVGLVVNCIGGRCQNTFISLSPIALGQLQTGQIVKFLVLSLWVLTFRQHWGKLSKRSLQSNRSLRATTVQQCHVVHRSPMKVAQENSQTLWKTQHLSLCPLGKRNSCRYCSNIQRNKMDLDSHSSQHGRDLNEREMQWMLNWIN